MKHKTKAPVITGIVAASVVLVALVVFGCQWLLDPFDNRIAQGVTIGGLDVGGMTRTEARIALKDAALETVLVKDLVVELPKDTVTLPPYSLGMELDVRSAVRTAFRYGRTEDGTFSEIGLLSYMTFSEDPIRSALQNYADTYDTDLGSFTYRMEGEMPDLSTAVALDEVPCQSLQVTMGLPTAHLDVDAAFGAVMEALDRAIGACYQDTYGVQVDVEDLQVPALPDVNSLYEECYVAPVDDSLDMKTYGFVNGSYGYHFNKESAAEILAAAGYGETVSIPMECINPEIMGDGVYFRDVLGYCETKHNDNENRNNNLRLLCAALDGFILEPGQDFSYNETVGERTTERGYLPAPAFSGKKLVDSVGGGVCQGSSTLYNCVLLADLEVTYRAGHGAPINYLPLGLDATVSWGFTDFTFRNNAHFPVMLKAEVADGYVKMQILGTDEKDYYVVLEPRQWTEEDVTYANTYMLKYDKETNELISREQITHSSYRNLEE